jgi:hypothetical protein
MGCVLGGACAGCYPGSYLQGDICVACVGNTTVNHLADACRCNDGHFPVTASPLVCQLCHYSCSSCTNGIHCSTCQPGLNMMASGVCMKCPSTYESASMSCVCLPN